MIRSAVLGRAAAVAILFSGAFTVSARAQEVSVAQLAAARECDRVAQCYGSLR